MGDFGFGDLTRPGGMYPQHADSPCAGCGDRLSAEDRCYASHDHVWHTGCFPKVREATENPAGSPRVKDVTDHA